MLPFISYLGGVKLFLHTDSIIKLVICNILIGGISNGHLLHIYVFMFYHIYFRPDCIGTVLWAERDKFDEIKERLRILLENQITHFRYLRIVQCQQ